MGCPIGFVLDPTGAVCVPDGSGTDPSYYTPPATGDIFGSIDETISPPQGNADGCYVGETDPLTGDTIASCSGTAGGGVQPTGITPTPVSTSAWASIGTAVGSIFGAIGKTGSTTTATVPAGSKRCTNGQIVLNSAACPGTGLAALGGSSTGLVLVLALVLIVIYALRK